MKKGVLFTAIAYVGVWLLVGAYWLCGQTTESPLWIVMAFASGGSPIDGGLSLGYCLHYLQQQRWAYPFSYQECTSPQKAH